MVSELRVVETLLRDAVADGLRLVIVVRGDAFGRLAELPGLASAAGAGTVLVGAPEPDELRQVVRAPASRAGLTVEPALVEAVVADVAGRPAALPLLSTALVGTWERRDGSRLTLAGYVAAGGAASALERLAEEAYAAMGDAERAAARRLLLRLVVDEDGRWARRAVVLADAGISEDPATAKALAALSDRRLVTVGSDDVQLSHEALTVAWPRFAGWLADRSATSGVTGHLVAAAAAWSAGGRDPSEVYRGARLQAAIDLATSHPEELGPVERSFVEAGRAEASREIRRLRAGRRRLAFVAGGLVVLLGASIAAGFVAVDKSNEAADAARVADAQRLGLQAVTRGDPAQALLLAVAAIRLDRSASTEATLLAALQGSLVPIESRGLSSVASGLAVSRDGSIAAVEEDASIDVFAAPSMARTNYDVRSAWSQGRPSGTLRWIDGRRAMLAGAVDPSRVVYVDALSGGSSLFASGWDPHRFTTTSDGRWAVAVPSASAEGVGPVLLARRTTGTDGDVRIRLAGVPLSITSASGATIVASESGAVLEVIDLDEPATRTSVRLPSTITGITASADGSAVAGTRPDGTIAVLDLRSGRPITVLPGVGQPEVALALSPDGLLLAVAGAADGGALVWVTATGVEHARISSPAGPIEAVAWGASGRTLYATISGRPVLQAWDLTDRAGISTPLVAAGPVSAGRPTASALDADGRVLAVGTDDGRPWFLDLDTREVTVAASPSDADRAAVSIAFVNDGAEAVVADVRGVISVWDVASGRLLDELTRPSGVGAAVPLAAHARASPDGQWVASYSDGSTLRVLDVTGRLAPSAYYPDLGPQSSYEVLGWHPDGRTLLVAANGPAPGEGRPDVGGDPEGIWAAIDMSTGTATWTTQAPERASGADAAFIESGRTIVIPGVSGRLHFVDAASGASLGRDPAADEGAMPVGSAATPVSVSASPDGRLLSVASAVRPIEIWDVATGEMRGSIAAPPGTVAAGFVSDSELVVLTDTGGVEIIDLDVDVWIERACRAAGRELTAREWQRFLPAYPYRPVCASTITARGSS